MSFLLRAGCRNFCFCIAIVSWLASSVTSQQVPKSPDEAVSFLARLGYLKAEFPDRRLNTCIAVLPDGRFHLERNWSQTATVGWGSEVFEGTLNKDDLASLLRILASADIRNMKPGLQPRFGMGEGEIVRALLQRPEGSQYLYLVGLGSLPDQHPKPLPPAVAPLLKWIVATDRRVEKQKELLVKGGKRADCWLPKSPES